MSLTIPPARIVAESSSPLLVAPEPWPRRALGDVAQILNGYAFKSSLFVQDGGIPLIRIRDIFSDRTAVNFAGDYDGRYIVRRDEFLVGMDGDFNCARWRGPDALLNQRVCKIVPDPKSLDLDFLTHILPAYLRAIHDVTSSSTVAHLSSRDIAQIPIPVPSLREQKALAGVLDSASLKRSSARTHLSTATRAMERFRNVVLAAACAGRLTADWRDANTDAVSVEQAVLELGERKKKPRGSSEPELSDLPLPEVAGSYLMSTVGQASMLVEYGTSQRADVIADGVPVLRMGNIQEGRLDFSDLKYCTVDSEIERLMLVKGDLLFNRTNSPELVGKSAVFNEDTPMTFASYLIRVRFSPDVALPEFVNYWINSAWGRAWARHVKTDGVSQSNINGTKLAAMPLPLPPIEEQREIVHRASLMLMLRDQLLGRLGNAQLRVDRTVQAVLAKSLRDELPGA